MSARTPDLASELASELAPDPTPEFAAEPAAPVARVDDRSDRVQARSGVWIHRAAEALARDLAGFPPGAVLLRTCDGPAFHAGFLGALRSGRAVLPLSPGTPEGAALAAAQASAAVVTVASDGPADAPRAEPVGELAAPQSRAGALPAGVLLHTSGSTAAPRTAFRTAESLAAVGRACAEAIGLRPDDHVFAVAPLAHSYGLEHGLLMTLAAGCRVTCAAAPRAPGPWLLAAIEAARPTVVPAVPVLLDRLAAEAGGAAAAVERLLAAGVRCLYTAGGVLPPGLAGAFAEAGLPVGQVFGSTEVGSVTWGPPGEAAGVGRPLAGVRLRVGDDGALAVRSPWALAGDLGPDGTLTPAVDADGFFATGDLARLDATGALHLLGRGRLLVDVGGRKVNPAEVEAALCALPGVADAAVLPLVQSETITRLQAFVEVPDAASAPADSALRAALREQLAGHKIPRRFHRLAALPRTAAGKADRAALARMADSLP